MSPSQTPYLPERINPPLTSRLVYVVHKHRPHPDPTLAPKPSRQMTTYNVNTYHTNRARFEVGPAAAAGGLAQEKISWVLYKNKYEKCGRCGSWRRRFGGCEGRCRTLIMEAEKEMEGGQGK